MSEQIVIKRLRKTFIRALEESFENVHGIYLDQNTSLLETLAEVTAEEASRPASPKGASIAAHAEHCRFYLSVLEDYLQSRPIGKLDWEATWLKTAVSPTEWEQLQRELKASYQRIFALVKGFDTWEGEHDISGALAVLLHTAYHIGAIRQIMAVVK